MASMRIDYTTMEWTSGAGGYGLNPKGQPHSAMIAMEVVDIDRTEP